MKAVDFSDGQQYEVDDRTGELLRVIENPGKVERHSEDVRKLENAVEMARRETPEFKLEQARAKLAKSKADQDWRHSDECKDRLAKLQREAQRLQAENADLVTRAVEAQGHLDELRDLYHFNLKSYEKAEVAIFELLRLPVPSPLRGMRVSSIPCRASLQSFGWLATLYRQGWLRYTGKSKERLCLLPTDRPSKSEAVDVRSKL